MQLTQKLARLGDDARRLLARFARFGDDARTARVDELRLENEVLSRAVTRLTAQLQAATFDAAESTADYAWTCAICDGGPGNYCACACTDGPTISSPLGWIVEVRYNGSDADYDLRYAERARAEHALTAVIQRIGGEWQQDTTDPLREQWADARGNAVYITPLWAISPARQWQWLCYIALLRHGLYPPPMGSSFTLEVGMDLVQRIVHPGETPGGDW